MIGLKILFLLWMSMGLSCTTRRKQRLCRPAGQILDNGSFTPLNKMKRKYVCRSDFVSNIPDLEKLTFKCKFERKSDSYEWKAKLTRVDTLYLRTVTCERKKKCSDPPLPRNMTREITTRYLISISRRNDRKTGNDFYTGDTLKYRCKPGFTLLSDLETSSFFNGDDFGDYNNKDDKSPQLTTTAAPVTVSVLKDITCDAAGFWNGFPNSQLYFGECQAIQCNASVFADISDGNISNFKETYEFLEEMKLECKDGYRHKGGVKSALCMTPSSFSNVFLTGFGCERIKCIELESPGNGYLKIDHNYVNGTVNYECDSGYDLIGYPVWKCQSNGEWDHDCVKCAHKDAYCLPPCLPPGAMSKTSSGRYQVGDVLEFTCKFGKYYGGSTNRTCLKNRYWSGTPIDCTGTSLVDLRVGIELVSALKQISQNRTKSDTAIPKTINVWHRKGVDMYLLVDISKVETPEKMNETLSFVYALLPELGINDGDTGTRLALTFFGTKPYRMFEHHIKSDEVEGPFKSYEDVIKELGHYNKTSELHTIKQVTKDGTEIGAALKDIYEQIKTKLKGQKHRRDRISQQVLIVISDGRLTSTDDPTDLSLSLKEDFDVEIYSIAIGDLRDTKGLETMRKLASQIENEQHFFKISTDESNFKLVMSSMINKDCLNVSCGSTKPNLTCISNASENRFEVNAKKNAWPWMADLRTLHSHECGGSVINDQWILTAAHCFDHKSVTKVHLGKKALNGTDGYDEYHIATIHKHDNYNNKTKKYDIALVRLSQKINRKLELLPVCLWDKTIQDETRVTYEKLFTKTYGVVTGWGKTNSKSKLSDTLKQMQMEVKSSEECLENLTSKEKDHISTSLMFCAGGNEIVNGKTQIVDTCQGDSGGPFVVRHPVDERKFIQTGIVSFGFGCKQMGKYGFYTKLTEELLGWINDTIEKVEKKAEVVEKTNGVYTEPGEEKCDCIDGGLKSINGGQKPKFTPDPCKVPLHFDTRLSISNRTHASLSGGSIVKVGDIVYFNCSTTDNDIQEPVNRRFICINGQWIENEQDESWTFGNNGTFPKCRKANCEPNCENGGICSKDDYCSCKHLTSGKHCEKVICDDKCYANNGECVGPGKCKCPEEKFGVNCEENHCKVPDEFDTRLSISDKFHVSLSGGSVVEVEDYVFFNCSEAGDDMHEPVNRRFKCLDGQWIEDERDKSWKFGNNGSFPKCRKTKCEPNCENGGVCLRDDQCKCKHLTSGKRCENVICDDKCYANDGKCFGPGKCKCPEGKYGANCEQRSCRLPENKVMAKVSTQKSYFAFGETVRNFTCQMGHFPSSDQGMTCRSNGSWSDIVTCVKGKMYLISTKTRERFLAGTDANVYITLFGPKGRTRRINLMGSFEPDYADEIRIFARDVRPIHSVQIGHDGGILSDWYLEYVSIYVENIEEFYVFRNIQKQWVKEGSDLTLEREGNQSCINTFGEKYIWYPRGREINVFFLGMGPWMSSRACKQACINWRKNVCSGVFRETKFDRCYGFSETRDEYFEVKNEPWYGELFFRTCKKFN